MKKCANKKRLNQFLNMEEEEENHSKKSLLTKYKNLEGGRGRWVNDS